MNRPFFFLLLGVFYLFGGPCWDASTCELYADEVSGGGKVVEGVTLDSWENVASRD